MTDTFFPLAVWYGASRSRAPMMTRAPLNVNEINRDLQNISNLGFNTVKYWVDWATCEPEAGSFSLSNVDKFLDMVNDNNLKSVVQIYLDSAPNWIAREYPDALFESHSGHRVESQASPGYSFDHPDVKKEAADFLTNIGKELTTKEALTGWDIWSEPHLVNWSWFDYMGANPWFEYGKHTRLRFVKWLKNKYKDISKLNDTWYRTYDSWDDVKIPKYVTLSTFADVLDMQYFTVDKMREDMRWKVASLRRGDPGHIISSHSAITSVATSILEWGANGSDWEYAKEVDLWGTSFYPKHIGWINPYDFSTMGFFLDATRSSLPDQSKGYWVGELQSGQGLVGFNFGVPVTGQDLELWAWICIATGSKGLFYYAYYPMSVGEEISGFGLVSQDGRISKRSLSIKNVSEILNEHGEMFMESKPLKADIAILTDYKSKAFSTALRKNPGEIISASMRGTYRIVNDNNIQVDFLDTQNLTEENISSYKVIFAPCLFVADGELVSQLTDYVSGGGTLVAEFRPGWSDPSGGNVGGIPGSGFGDLFGCQESYVENQKKTTLKFGLGDSVYSFDYGDLLQVIEPFSAEVVGRNTSGEAIATLNKYGKGKSILIGAMISRMFEKDRTNGVSDFYNYILSSSGVEPWAVSRENDEIRFRLLKSKDNWILFAFNTGEFSNEKVIVQLSERIKFTKVSMLKGIGHGAESTGNSNANSITMSFMPNSINIAMLS